MYSLLSLLDCFYQRRSSSSSESESDFVPSEEGSGNVSAEEPRPSHVSSSESESDFVPSEEGSGNVPAEEPRPIRVRSARRCANRNINYAVEKHDSFFNNTAGYTDFQRTRKGGDRRPNAAGTLDNTCSEIPTSVIA